MTLKDWNKIKQGILNETYKMVRLVRINDGKSEVLVNYNKVTSKKQEAMQRFDYIKSKVSDLPAGHYQVQCKLSPTNHSIQDNFDLVIQEKAPLQIGANGKIIDKTSEQETDMGHHIDFNDYLEKIEENAELRAQVTMLTAERDMYKKLYEKGLSVTPALNDPPEEKPKTPWETAFGVLTENLPTLVPMVQEHYAIKNRELDIKEKQLSMGGSVSKTTMTKKIVKRDPEAEARKIAKAFQELYETDEDEFNAQMDQMESDNPDLYDKVCEILGIEYEEEEEEGGEEE